jgi:hypothetical protein
MEIMNTIECPIDSLLPNSFYTLVDFHRLKKEPMEYTLPKSILTILEKIEKDLGFSERKIESFVYSPFMISSCQNPGPKFSGQGSGPSRVYQKSSGTWENVRSFKTTKIEKKEGTEKYIQDIRVCLNKISNKNYDTQRDTIMTLMRTLCGDSVESNEIRTVALAIFDIASSNQFYSEMYAQLYKECIQIYPVFYEILDTYLNTYTHSVTELVYVDPNKDYDAYCEYNKKNDVRKAMGVFITHLMNKSVLDIARIFSIMECFLALAFQYVDEANRLNEIEEITEILFLLVKGGISTFCSKSTSSGSDSGLENKWVTTIYPKLLVFSQFKVKEKVSLSSRVLFKYMDIMELIRKSETKI